MCADDNSEFAQIAESLQQRYAVLIREQMTRQGLSVRGLATEGVIKKHRKNDFFARLREGRLTINEFNRVMARLEIDPVRAAISFLCDRPSGSYEDPCCETVSLVATSLAKHLPGEMESCEGTFETLRAGLCDMIAQKNATTIARHHQRIEGRHNGEGFDHAYG